VAFDGMLRRVDIALPTLDDDQALFGLQDSEDCARRLHGLGVGEVVVKLGRLGCFLSLQGRTARVPAEPVARVVDSTAAGDSFNAGYLAARLAGIEPEVAAEQGNRIAARVIAHPGAVIPVAAMTDLMPDAS
jgi:2-dehydro-3-deoxygluconokinase